MKKIFYSLLVILCLHAAQITCQTVAQRDLSSGGAAVRQERLAAWGQTQHAYRGMGSQQVESEGGTVYGEEE